MWAVEVQKQLQLLQIRFAGRVDLAEADACRQRVCDVLPELQPGFCLLTDLSGLQEMDPGCGTIIDEVMDALNRSGVAKVVRVVPDPRTDIGFGIMSLFHYQPQVRVVTCQSLAEAKPHLPA